MTHHHHHHHHDQDAAADDDQAMAEMLDLDAEVLPDYLHAAATWVREWASTSPRRVLDLGAGTGTGTLALAPLFPDAELLAVDGSAELLSRLDEKAHAAGVSDRLHTTVADLNDAWPAIEPVDVVWTSLFLHHLVDPDRALAGVHGVLQPGGVVAVLEMDELPRFLPDDVGLGRPGLEARAHAALSHEREASMPDLGADWGPRLASAGFDVVGARSFAIDPPRPYPPSAGRYAQLFLHRLRGAVDDRLDADDLATFDTILTSPALLDGDRLAIRGVRRGWLARRG